MDFIDELAWVADAALYRRRIGELGEQLQRAQNERDLANWDARKVRELAEENLELKLRLGMLIRLLIAKNVITAQEYASLLAEARRESAG
jgi:hypothetical protein